MNYEEGLRVIHEFLEANQIGGEEKIVGKMHSEDVLLCSLVDRIPKGTDILGRKLRGVMGVSFEQADSPKQGKLNHHNYRLSFFRREIGDAIKFFLLPRETNIPATLDHTSSSYIHCLTGLWKNRGISKIAAAYIHNEAEVRRLEANLARLDRTNFTRLLTASASALEKEPEVKAALTIEGARPLVDLATGTELNSAARFNVRKVLEKLLDADGELSDVEEILFTDAGIYYYKGEEIRYLPLTASLIDFLGEDMSEKINDRREKMNSLDRRGELDEKKKATEESRKKIQAIFRRVLVQNRKPEYFSPLEKTIAAARAQGFTLPLANLKEVKLLEDPEYQKELLRLLDLVKSLAPAMPELMFDLDIDKKKPESERRETVAVFAQRNFQELLNPQWWKGQLYSLKGYPDFTRLQDTDLRIAHQHQELYNPIFIQKMLAHLYLHLVGSAAKREVYTHFRALIGLDRIYQDSIKLIPYGFTPSAAGTEQAVLNQYFMKFGTLYVNEVNSATLDARLPMAIREFFQRHISKSLRAMTGGGTND